MTNEQWGGIAAHIANLWRPFAQCMTLEQAQAWRAALDDCPVDRVKDALLRWYQSEEGWPVLSKIVARSRVEVRTIKPASASAITEAERVAAAELTKREARRGLELLAQRRAQRQEAGVK